MTALWEVAKAARGVSATLAAALRKLAVQTSSLDQKLQQLEEKLAHLETSTYSCATWRTWSALSTVGIEYALGEVFHYGFDSNSVLLLQTAPGAAAAMATSFAYAGLEFGASAGTFR